MRLGLGVGAVELDVAEGPLGLRSAAPRPGRPDRPARRARAGRPGPARPAPRALVARLQLALDPAPSGERPLGHHDGLAVGVVERVLGEPRLHEVDELAVAQRVPDARGHVVDGGPGGVGAGGGHGDDGGHHQVDGDDVDHALGDAGELLQQAPGVGDDDRLGHPEAPDPSRAGLGQGRLDDRGPHDGDGHGRRASRPGPARRAPW